MELTLHTFLGLLTEPWALLMLGASLLYALMNHLDEWLLARLGGNAEDGEGHDGVGKLVIISGLFGLVTALVFGCVAVFFPGPSTTTLVESDLIWQAVAIGALELVWLIPYLYATSRSGAVESAPLFQSVPVIALVLGLVVFGEVPPAIHIVGSLAIIAGGFILNLVPDTLKLNWVTIVLMLFASTVVALIYFLFKGAATEGNFVATAFWSGLGMFGATIAVFVFWPPYRRQFLDFLEDADKGSLIVQFMNEVMNMTSVLMSQLAMMIGPSVMAVSALNAYQPVFVLLVGWVRSKFAPVAYTERLRGMELFKKTGAIALIALGTVLIAQ